MYEFVFVSKKKIKNYFGNQQLRLISDMHLEYNIIITWRDVIKQRFDDNSFIWYDWGEPDVIKIS